MNFIAAAWNTTIKNVILTLIASLSLTLPPAANFYMLRAFDIADGLPTNVIAAITQTAEDGLLWIGTIGDGGRPGGLRYYYNGEFLSPVGPEAVENGRIDDLLATPEGDLWVATPFGLFHRYPDGNWQNSPVESVDGYLYEISTLFQTRNGVIWAGGPAGLFRLEDKILVPFEVNGAPLYVRALSEDQEGALWVTVLTSIGPKIYVLKGSELVKTITSPNRLAPSADLIDLEVDEFGNIWIATNEGLVQFDGYEPEFVYTENEGLISSTITAILNDPLEGMWVGTAGGLLRLQNGKVEESITTVDGLPKNSITTLFIDCEGNLWIGTTAGLVNMTRATWLVENDPLLRYQRIFTFLPGLPGKALVSTPGGLARQLNNGDWEYIFQDLEKLVVNALETNDEGIVWVGTNYGLFIYKNEHLIADPKYATVEDVNDLLLDEVGRIWVATNEGLYYFFGEKEKLFSVKTNDLRSNTVISLWQTHTNIIWAGTSNGGVSYFDENHGTIITQETTGNMLCGNTVRDGLEDSTGNIWFATINGLCALKAGGNPQKPEDWLDLGQVMPISTQINALLEDIERPGYIWVGGNDGLELINFQDKLISHFSVEDGLSSRWVNDLGQDEQKRLWIATEQGLNYHLNLHQAPIVSPPDLESIDHEIYCLNKDHCLNMTVPYDVKEVTIKFQANDLGDLDGLRYQLVIEPSPENIEDLDIWFDTKQFGLKVLQPKWFWSKPDMYTISVIAHDHDFNFSETSLPKTLIVTPPKWYEFLGDHEWILIFIFVVLVVLAIFVYRAWNRRRFVHYPVDLDIEFTGPFQVNWNMVWKTGFWKFRRKREKSGQSNLDREVLNEVCEAAEEIEASPIVSAKTLVKMGSGLKQLLFSAESQKALTETQAGIIDTRMRIKLPRYRTLRSLPWEFIQVRSGKSSGFESKLTVIRELMPAKVSIGERDNEENRLVKNKPLRLRELKVLVTTVNQKPEFGQLILLEKEIEKITNVLESSKRWKTKIQPLPDPTWDDFGDEIRKGYNIVYFSGHGGVHDMAVHTDLGLKIYHENVLFFRGSDGNPLPIDQDRLVKLFAENQLKDETSRTCLVYLNACQSATVLQGVASIAESLVQQARVTAVVGMGYKITEESAIIFGEEFFKVLINQGQVDWAVREGRRKLASHIGEGSRSWGVPRLYTCTEADQLFMHI